MISLTSLNASQVGLDVNDTAIEWGQCRSSSSEQPFPRTCFGWRPVPSSISVPPSREKLPAYEEDEDPISKWKLNVEHILHKDGINVYKDQASRLWSGLATYWIKRGEFDYPNSTFETRIASVLTARDFTQIFDAYVQSTESFLNAMMAKSKRCTGLGEESSFRGGKMTSGCVSSIQSY
jgi:pre-mRNA-splicing factor SYF1